MIVAVVTVVLLSAFCRSTSGADLVDQGIWAPGISWVEDTNGADGLTPEQTKELLGNIDKIFGESDAYPNYEGRTGASPREVKVMLLEIQAELLREQNVITQEIGATEDAPDDLVFDRLQETAFPDQPIGRSILGTPDTVRSFSAKSLRTYLGRNYRAPNMLVAAAGAVDHAQIVA